MSTLTCSKCGVGPGRPCMCDITETEVLMAKGLEGARNEIAVLKAVNAACLEAMKVALADFDRQLERCHHVELKPAKLLRDAISLAEKGGAL